LLAREFPRLFQTAESWPASAADGERHTDQASFLPSAVSLVRFRVCIDAEAPERTLTYGPLRRAFLS